MKKCILMLPLFCSILMLYAQTPEELENKNAPVITFEERFVTPEGIVYDYGTIDKNSDGTCYFVFTNTGKEPLVIEKATSTCGCTVPNPPLYPILPGQKDSIAVKYNTSRAGTINKAVTVFSNATNNGVMMRIKGNVQETASDDANAGAAPKQ